MAGAACGMQFMLSALLTQSFGAYVAVLSDERGWSKTALSGAAALQSVEAAIVGPLLGVLMDRFGPGSMIRIGIVVFGLGFVALSQIDSLAGFYMCSVLLAGASRQSAVNLKPGPRQHIARDLQGQLTVKSRWVNRAVSRLYRIGVQLVEPI